MKMKHIFKFIFNKILDAKGSALIFDFYGMFDDDVP
jgi:hypothetical protein